MNTFAVGWQGDVLELSIVIGVCEHHQPVPQYHAARPREVERRESGHEEGARRGVRAAVQAGGTRRAAQPSAKTDNIL